MKKINYKQGFTLIELLVVIAIIGILSTIVLGSLSTARSQGEDAAIKSTLNNMRAQAELYYVSNTTTPNTYGPAATQCDVTTPSAHIFNSPTPGLSILINDLKSKLGLTTVTSDTDSTLRCQNTSTAWVIVAKLKTGTNQYACVDSSGVAKTISFAASAAMSNTNFLQTRMTCN